MRNQQTVEQAEIRVCGREGAQEIKNLTTTSALFMRKDSGLCAFCLGNHAHENCRKLSNLDEREKIIRNLEDASFVCKKDTEQQNVEKPISARIVTRVTTF